MPDMAQTMAALKRANEIRNARAALHRRIVSGEVDVIEVICDPPLYMRRTRPQAQVPSVCEILSWQTRWGRARAGKFLSRLGITDTIAPEDLSLPTKARIADAHERMTRDGLSVQAATKSLARR